MSAVRLREADLDALQLDRLHVPAPAPFGPRLTVAPSTIHAPRTMREARHDPFNWIESAEAAAAEDAHIRAMFAEPTGARARRHDRQQRVVDWILYALLAAIAVVLLAHHLGWMHWLPGSNLNQLTAACCLAAGRVRRS